MEQQAATLSAGLAARGHQLQIFTTPHPRGLTAWEERGVPVLGVGPGSFRGYSQRWWDASYAALASAHRQRPFDVIMSQSGGALGYLARAERELALGTVVVMHGTILGELHTRWEGRGTWRGLARLAQLFAVGPPNLLRWRAAGRHAHGWIVLSSAMRDDLLRENPLPPARVHIIHNGVDPERFRPDPALGAATRARLGIAPDAPLLLYAGRIEREKGVHVLLRAFATVRERLPQARLLIAGDGSYRAAIAAQLGDGVTMLGALPNEQIPALLAAADLFVLPTLCHEGFPMSVAEALASGVPVLASRKGGLVDAVLPGVTGELLPPGDAAALAAAIIAPMTDPPRRDAMARAARADALVRMSQEQMVTKTEAVLAAAWKADV